MSELQDAGVATDLLEDARIIVMIGTGRNVAGAVRYSESGLLAWHATRADCVAAVHVVYGYTTLLRLALAVLVAVTRAYPLAAAERLKRLEGVR